MNNNQLDITYIKKCFLMSQKAEAVPPLGTILGNIGVNTIKFCEEFNNYTTELPQYFVVRVIITVYENRSFSFIIIEPTTSFFLNILKFEKKIKVKVHDRWHEKVITCINLKDLLQLALFKFPNIPLEKSIEILWGSIKSMSLIVI